MSTKKLGRPTDQRLALVYNLATDLLWFGKIETTLDRAKEAAKIAERCITIAINGYKDVVTDTKTSVDAKGKEKTVKVSKDGVAKLNARRKLLALLYERKDIKAKGEKKEAFAARANDYKHPLIEKLFDEIAPKYDARNTENGQGGGYTRVIKTSVRRGDAAQLAIVELI